MPADAVAPASSAPSATASRVRAVRQHRRVMRGLAVAMLLVVSMGLVGVAGPAGQAAAATPDSEAWDFFARTNQFRASAGLAPLRMQPNMVDLAANWNHHMVATYGRLVHNSNLAVQVAAVFPDWQGTAENIGYGSSVAQVQQAFLNSELHRRNILGDYNYVGISTLRDGGGRLWVTIDFLKLDRAAPTIMPITAAEATALVRATYQDFFGRAPSNSELSGWVGALRTSLEPNDYLRAIVTSPEWVSKLIVHYYQDTLGRNPDQGGLNYWVGRVRAGMTPAAVAAEFYASPEYFSRSGGTAESWIRSLYAKLLGRTPDAGGLSYWTGRLSRGEPRSRLAYEFYQSVESRSVRVIGLYQQLLGRNPDGAGLRYWIGQLGDGNDLRLALELAASPEYRARALARY